MAKEGLVDRYPFLIDRPTPIKDRLIPPKYKEFEYFAHPQEYYQDKTGLYVDGWWHVYYLEPNKRPKKVGIVWPDARPSFKYEKDGKILEGKIKATTMFGKELTGEKE